MNQLSYRDTWAEVSLEAIRYNTKQFKDFIDDSVHLMAVVKADGYGHGAVPVAQAAIQAGADYLAVALLDEALQLREAGITHPILILGYTANRSIPDAIQADIDLTVFTQESLEEIILQSSQLNKNVSIHIKVDTGMSRIGVQSKEDALSIASRTKDSSHVILKGIFTHFANADSEDPSYTYMQFERFTSVISYLEQHQITIPLKHCCNSAGTMNFPNMHLDMVRVGIALYGLYPDVSLKGHSIKLKQAMSLKTKIAWVKNVAMSQPISYGCTYVPTHDSVIATLPIGYADGLSRLLSNKGEFLLHEQKVPVVGRVCMDQLMIDVTNVPQSKLGDMVTIFGNTDSSFQSVDEIAKLMGTINYEVVCLIGKRIPRVYKEN